MPRGFLRKDNLTKDTLLKLLQGGLIVFAATTSPFFLTRFIQEYFKDRSRRTAWRRTELLKNLEKKQAVSIKEMPDSSIKIELTQQGRKWVRQYKLDELKINRPGKWDGKWRLIFYDIPEYNRKARRALSQKLRDLNLYQLQKSIWVSPYKCLPELEFLCSVFNIDMNRHIFYLEVPNIPKEQNLRRWFKL